MLSIVIFPRIIYFVVFAVCVFAMAVAFFSHKKSGFKDRVRFVTVFLASFCGILVSIVYFLEGRALSGLYVVHLSYAFSPLFMQRLFNEGWLSYVCPLTVTISVLVAVIFSYFNIMTWDVVNWIPPLMGTGLLILIGANMWRLTEGRERFDAVAAGKGWSLSLADILYYSVLVLFASVGLAVGVGDSWNVTIIAFLLVVLLIGLGVAVWLRQRDSRAFLFLHSREEKFIGNISRSTRAIYVNNEEFGLSGENLFIRLKEYFDEKLPYLNPDLTLMDVAKSLITNKVYLSRAINDFTGQNFCQFVNLYRVKYSIKLFSSNSAYTTADMAFRSGFHSLRSFTMAFRLYMNISPSRWCKQNKTDSVVNVLRN